MGVALALAGRRVQGRQQDNTQTMSGLSENDAGQSEVSGMGHDTELPRGPDAPRAARRALERWFGDSLGGEDLADAKLLASELVSNAVIHGRGQISLRAQLDEDRVLIEVMDEGAGFEHTVRKVPFDHVAGRGLGIVDTVSSRWGIHEGTTHVWAELEREGPRLGEDKKPELETS
jgi:anti-sigma regulatory factor (Ser/Thr protein kinase)